jgi:hypothetical protein
MSEIELEKEFKKCRLEEKPLCASEEQTACSCPTTIVKSLSLLEVSGNKLKMKDRRNSLVRPARLKVLGNSYAKKMRTSSEKSTEDGATADINIVRTSEKVEAEFASEAFQKMRISSTPSDSPSHHPNRTTESPLGGDKDERLPSTSASSSSSSLNCSTQAKLQQQMSTTEFDSQINEMSEFLAYHLSLFNHRDKYLIDSMYT